MTFCITGPGEYKTRGGAKAIILGKNPEDLSHPWIGYFEPNTVAAWTNSGRFAQSPEYKMYCDIVSVWKEPVIVEGWINVYPDNLFTHSSKDGANRYAGDKRVACRKIRWDGIEIIDVTEEV